MTSIASIEFAPLLPWPLLAGLAGLSLLLLGIAAWRRGPALGWRTLALTVALLALANPSLVQEERDPLDDVAVVLVDRSLSQDIGQRQERTDEAAAALGETLQAMPHMQLRVVEAGQAESGPDSGDGTRLLSALRRALSDVPQQRLSTVIVVSDGQIHDAEETPAERLPDAPMHLLLTGERDERDRRLVVERAPRYGIVGEPLSLDVMVEDQGRNGAGTAQVTVTQDGGGAETHQVPVGRPHSIPFRLSHGGTTLLEVAVEEGPQELTLANNRALLVVNGVRDRLRVLLVSGEPHAGERTWRNLLKADPSVDLVHFTILRPPEKQDGTPIGELSLISFPTRELFETKLEEFDLIIFDRYRRRGVLPDLYLRNVAEYVRGGGAVLSAAGPAFATPLSIYRTPLSEVLPAQPTGDVITTGFRPTLTELGRRHPVSAELPGALDEETQWGRWFRMVDAEATGGTVLMQGPEGRPILVLDRVEEGRVAQLLSDHAWLWARGFEGGGPQAELLRRAAHWLMKEPDLEEEDLRATSDDGRLRVVRQSLSADPVTAEVTSPSGEVTELPLTDDGRGRATGVMAVREPGLYQVSDGRMRTAAAVGDLNAREYADLRSTAEPLRPHVAATGGGVHWLADGLPDVRRVRPERPAAGSDWIGVRANGDYLVTGVTQIPLLPAWLTLVLALGFLMLTWYREGR